MGQQHLGGMPSATLEAALPGLHQTHLADRGRRLEFMQRGGAGLPAHARHPLCHSPGRDQYDFVPCVQQFRQLVDPVAQAIAIQALAVPSNQGAADLHHPATRLADLGMLLHERVGS